jgi:hypothetical protein
MMEGITAMRDNNKNLIVEMHKTLDEEEKIDNELR